MTADECRERASECAACAGLAVSEAISLEFLVLAAQWRSMALRMNYVGPVDTPAGFISGLPMGSFLSA